VHRDLKPENILTGRDKEKNTIYLVDFGISKYYRDEKGQHIEFNENKPFIGTTRYASIAAHKGVELGRKDDLESLAYVLIYMAKGYKYRI
jgi:casein kinase 1